MKLRITCVLLIIPTICYALTEKSEYTPTPEVAKKYSTDDRLLANIVRARNSSKVLHGNSNDSETNDKNVDKKPRTVIRGPSGSDYRDNSSCCGSRYNSNSSHRPDSHYNKASTEGPRYPSQYGERVPVDRYGWQTQSRPPGSNGNGRPSGSYGGSYGGTYSGSTSYGGSQTGDRFGSRPGYGGENSRPGNYGSGGYVYGNGGYGYGSGRPPGFGVGGYGISGTLDDGDEFGPEEPNFPEGNPPLPPHPSIQTQKAVALKALAGVALIGAAAALATNPVLLPIGIVSGRRKKRSEFSINDEDIQLDYIMRILKHNFAKVYFNETGSKLVMSPKCVARLSCEIQKNYLSDLKKDVQLLREIKDTEYRYQNLIRNNAPSAEPTNAKVKKLIKLAISVASSGGSCNLFQCQSVKTG